MSSRRGPGLRIVAGRHRGRLLAVPPGGSTRPARVLVRRSIFDSLQDAVVEARWLDLFAGSGSLGIEALSRGAAAAAFVEAGRPGLRCLQENLARLELGPPQAIILRQRLPGLLTRPPELPPFDFVSLDPPFAVSRSGDQLRALLDGLQAAAEGGWMKPDARLIWEEPSDAPAPVPGGFQEQEVRPFGTSRVRFFGRCPRA